VEDNARRIAGSLDWAALGAPAGHGADAAGGAGAGHGAGAGDGAPDVALARAIALLHDTGRFAQLRRCGSFSDVTGENHAKLSCDAIREAGVDGWFDGADARVLITAVAQHNAFRPSYPQDPRAAAHVKVIRDADKLDIFRINTDKAATRRYTLDNASPRGDFNEKLIAGALRHENLSYKDVHSSEDWAVFNIGLVYDLNFPASFQEALRTRYVESILSPYIGQHPRIPDIIRAANAYMEARAPIPRAGAGDS
jgi:hypothetical protein